MVIPTPRQPANPGPQVTAMESIFSGIEKSFLARSNKGKKFFKCSPTAKSGTTPPYSACLAI